MINIGCSSSALFKHLRMWRIFHWLVHKPDSDPYCNFCCYCYCYWWHSLSLRHMLLFTALVHCATGIPHMECKYCNVYKISLTAYIKVRDSLLLLWMEPRHFRPLFAGHLHPEIIRFLSRGMFYGIGIVVFGNERNGQARRRVIVDPLRRRATAWVRLSWRK